MTSPEHSRNANIPHPAGRPANTFQERRSSIQHLDPDSFQSPSDSFNESHNDSERSRWSFPASQYRHSAILEMGSAIPMEIANSDYPREIDLSYDSELGNTDFLPPVIGHQPREYPQHSIKDARLPRQVRYGSAAKSLERLFDNPSRPAPRDDGVNASHASAWPRSLSFDKGFVEPAFPVGPPPSATAPLSPQGAKNALPPLRVKRHSHSESMISMRSTRTSEEYATACESSSDERVQTDPIIMQSPTANLESIYRKVQSPDSSGNSKRHFVQWKDHKDHDDAVEQPSLLMSGSGLTGFGNAGQTESLVNAVNSPTNSSSGSNSGPSQGPSGLGSRPESRQRRRELNMKKLRLIIDEDDDDSRAADESFHSRSFSEPAKLPHPLPDIPGQSEHSSRMVSDSDSELSVEYGLRADNSNASSRGSQRRGSATVAPHIALKDQAPVSPARSDHRHHRKTQSDNTHSSRSKKSEDKKRRNFSKKSLQNMLDGNSLQYDIEDIGLPTPERKLMEKFISSLSKLSIEVQMDEGKREEGVRRMRNALRALEGWI